MSMEKTHLWRAMARLLAPAGTIGGGERVIRPSVEDLQHYLDGWDVRHFTAVEITTPHQPWKAREAGYVTDGEPLLLPPRSEWIKAAVLCLLADRMRDAARGPVTCRNWWRPASYNQAVGGAPASDHITCAGMDFDFRTVLARRRGQAVAERFYALGDVFRLSLGAGRRTLHVGAFSPAGHRRWKYGWGR